MFMINSMSHRISTHGPTCPITLALDSVGDKWSLIILRDIMFKGKKHYREFLASPERIATNILASRLKHLQADGLISKARDSQNQSKFVYRLTDKGKDLLPLLLELIRWSAKHNPQPDIPDNIISGAPARLLERLNQDRNALIEEILDGL